ncbi:hypothetical protein HD806DRAFT_532267 [Xylariaceae sp. AK1471]|nr:hypothetical protein HD806DRAFT_532267 [Xylariaceae sp. AK1471]
MSNEETIVIRADNHVVTPQPPHRQVDGKAEWTFKLKELSKSMLLATIGSTFVAAAASYNGLNENPAAYWAGFLSAPPTALRNAVWEMKFDHRVKNSKVKQFISAMPRVGYLVPRDCDAVKTWEVARSTSAAPMCVYPDGCVWLAADGYWHDGWLPRLARAYMSLMQGRSTWNDAACLVKRESKHIGHYRLDIALEGDIRLDDVSSMPLLRSLVLRDTSLKETIKETAQRLFAALFYFELTALPTPVGSRFRIEGQIVCTRKAGDSALPQIFQRLASSTLLINKKATRFKLAYDVYGNIVLPLVFFADQSFSLEVKQDRSRSSFPLSGSPYINSVLVSRGGLAASFSTRSHKRRRADCESRGRLSRRRRFL